MVCCGAQLPVDANLVRCASGSEEPNIEIGFLINVVAGDCRRKRISWFDTRWIKRDPRHDRLELRAVRLRTINHQLRSRPAERKACVCIATVMNSSPYSRFCGFFSSLCESRGIARKEVRQCR